MNHIFWEAVLHFPSGFFLIMLDQKIRQTNVLRRISLLAGLSSQCTSKISFPGTCESLKNNVCVTGNELACWKFCNKITVNSSPLINKACHFGFWDSEFCLCHEDFNAVVDTPTRGAWALRRSVSVRREHIRSQAVHTDLQAGFCQGKTFGKHHLRTFFEYLCKWCCFSQQFVLHRLRCGDWHAGWNRFAIGTCRFQLAQEWALDCFDHKLTSLR